MKKNILIAGGAGFIGSNLAGFFLSAGHIVTVIDNLMTGSKENIKTFDSYPQFKFIKADIVSDDFEKNLTSEPFDLLYHLASPASPPKYFRFPVETLMTNSLGTKNLLDLVKAGKAKTFIYASTSEVYGDPLEHPQKETYWGNVNPNGDRSCYDESKRFGEAICMAYQKTHNLDIRIARIFNTYGPNMEQEDGRVISNFVTQALDNKPLTVYGTGEQTRCFCFISDLVTALTLMGEKDINGQVINIGSDHEQSIIDIAKLVKQMTKTNAEVKVVPYPTDVPGDDPKRRKPDLSKAKELLSWQPVIKIEEGLVPTIEYFKNRLNL